MPLDAVYISVGAETNWQFYPIFLLHPTSARPFVPRVKWSILFNHGVGRVGSTISIHLNNLGRSGSMCLSSSATRSAISSAPRFERCV